MINDQSGRAAVELPASALMQDDGSVQPRVRLLRPAHADVITVEALERSHWRDATSEEFQRAWEAEVASLPELTESTFHIVTGLLLPVWNRLPGRGRAGLSPADRSGRTRHWPARFAGKRRHAP